MSDTPDECPRNCTTYQQYGDCDHRRPSEMVDLKHALTAQAAQIAALEAQVNPRPCQDCEGSECKKCNGSGFHCVGCATYSRAADMWQGMLTGLEAEVERLTDELRATIVELHTTRNLYHGTCEARDEYYTALAPFVTLATVVREDHLTGHQQSAEFVTGCPTCRALVQCGRAVTETPNRHTLPEEVQRVLASSRKEKTP